MQGSLDITFNSSKDKQLTFTKEVKIQTAKDSSNNTTYVPKFVDNGSIFKDNLTIAREVGATGEVIKVELNGTQSILTERTKYIANSGADFTLRNVNLQNASGYAIAGKDDDKTRFLGDNKVIGMVKSDNLTLEGNADTFNAKSSDADKFYEEKLYIKGNINAKNLESAKNFGTSGNITISGTKNTTIENAYIGEKITNKNNTSDKDGLVLTKVKVNKDSSGKSISAVSLKVLDSMINGDIDTQSNVEITNSEIAKLTNGTKDETYLKEVKKGITLTNSTANDSVTNYMGDINATDTTFKKGALADNLNFTNVKIYSPEANTTYEAKEAITFKNVTSTIDESTTTDIGKGIVKAKSGTIENSIINQVVDGDGSSVDKELFVKCSTLTGGIKNVKNLRTECSKIVGAFKVDKLNANDTIFILGGTSATYNGAIQSSVSTSGKNNAIGLVGVVKDNAFDKSLLDKNLLLAKLTKGDGDANKNTFVNALLAYKGITSYPIPKQYLVANEENGVITYSLDKDAKNTKASEDNIEPNYDNGTLTELRKEIADLGDSTKNTNPANEMKFLNDDAVISAKDLAHHIYYSQVLDYNNLNKRLGELRDNDNSFGVWSRAYTARAKTDDDKITSNAFIIGADKKHSLGDMDLYTGVLAEIGHSYMNNIDSSLNQYSAGVYASVLANDGLFIDTTAKIHHYKNKFSDKVLGNLQDSGTGFIVSAEVGKRFGSDYYLEPSVELIGHYIPSTTLVNENVSIKSDSKFMLATKLALFAGAKINENVAVRTGFGGVFDLRKNSSFSVVDENFNVGNEGKRDRRYFFNVGTNVKIGNNVRASFEFEKSSGKELGVDYQLNANIRYSF